MYVTEEALQFGAVGRGQLVNFYDTSGTNPRYMELQPGGTLSDLNNPRRGEGNALLRSAKLSPN